MNKIFSFIAIIGIGVLASVLLTRASDELLIPDDAFVQPYYIQPIFLPPVYQGTEGVPAYHFEPFEPVEGGVGGTSNITSRVNFKYSNGTTTSDDLLDIVSYEVTHPTTDGMDGFGISIPFNIEHEDGSATSTAEWRYILDDVSTTSIDSSIELYQKLDNDYTLTNVLDIDGGTWLFSTDVSTTTAAILEVARWTRLDDNALDPADGIGLKHSFFIESTAGQGATSGANTGTTTIEHRYILDDTATTSIEVSYQIWGKDDDGYTLSNWLELDSGDLIVDTDTLFVDISTDRVGISTSTPGSMFSVGNSNATSTIQLANPCFEMDVMDNNSTTTLFYWPCSAGDVAPSTCNWGWATSTSGCGL